MRNLRVSYEILYRVICELRKWLGDDFPGVCAQKLSIDMGAVVIGCNSVGIFLISINTLLWTVYAAHVLC